jgi:hypothetical protein
MADATNLVSKRPAADASSLRAPRSALKSRNHVADTSHSSSRSVSKSATSSDGEQLDSDTDPLTTLPRLERARFPPNAQCSERSAKRRRQDPIRAERKDDAAQPQKRTTPSKSD